MSNRPICDLLDDVLSSRNNRRFTVIDGQEKIVIPALVRTRGEKNQLFYETRVDVIAQNPSLKTNPNRTQMQNLAQAAMIYATFSELANNHEASQYLNAAFNAYHNSDGQNRRFTKEHVAALNQAWERIFKDKDLAKSISKKASAYLDMACAELDANGELTAAAITLTKAKAAGQLFIKSFQKQIVFGADAPLQHSNGISNIYNDRQEKIQNFYRERFGTTEPTQYLRSLLLDNSSDFKAALAEINLTTDVLADVPFRKNNGKASASEKLPSSVLKKYKVKPKGDIKGNISAYMKPDKEFGADVYHLYVNIVKFEGKNSVVTNVPIYSHMEHPTADSSRNLLVETLVNSAKVENYFTPEKIKAYQEQEEKAQARRAKFAQLIEKENKEKRDAAIEAYQSNTPVTNARQLDNTYFGQKGVQELAARYLPNLRVDGAGNVWLPLANVIQPNPSLENTEGFQEFLATVPENLETNKLYQGIGDGQKELCSVTIGDPSTASVIIETEGVVNGLIKKAAYDEEGINCAVVCALDVGNIPSIAEKIIAEHPTIPVVNFADNDLYDKHQQRRYVSYELAAMTKEQQEQVGVNVGIDRAIEMHKAVNIPFAYIDFENDVAGINLAEYQKENKASDVDDLHKGLIKALQAQGIEAPQEQAWEITKQVCTYKLKQALHSSVSPHWSIEDQHRFGWCPSEDKLADEQLGDYYLMKASIQSAKAAFQQKFGMPYAEYHALANTQHWVNEQNPEAIDLEALQQLDPNIDQYDSALDTHLETIDEVVTATRNFVMEPMVEADSSINISPTIDEDINAVDAKISVIQRKIHNLIKNQDSYHNIEERFEKIAQDIRKLADEKARLLNVSAAEILEQSSLRTYLDPNMDFLYEEPEMFEEPDLQEIPSQELQFEQIEDVPATDELVGKVDAAALFNKVMGQVDEPAAGFEQAIGGDQPLNEAYPETEQPQFIQEAPESLNSLDEVTHIDAQQEHYDFDPTQFEPVYDHIEGSIADEEDLLNEINEFRQHEYENNQTEHSIDAPADEPIVETEALATEEALPSEPQAQTQEPAPETVEASADEPVVETEALATEEVLPSEPQAQTQEPAPESVEASADEPVVEIDALAAEEVLPSEPQAQTQEPAPESVEASADEPAVETEALATEEVRPSEPQAQTQEPAPESVEASADEPSVETEALATEEVRPSEPQAQTQEPAPESVEASADEPVVEIDALAAEEVLPSEPQAQTQEPAPESVEASADQPEIENEALTNEQTLHIATEEPTAESVKASSNAEIVQQEPKSLRAALSSDNETVRIVAQMFKETLEHIEASHKQVVNQLVESNKSQATLLEKVIEQQNKLMMIVAELSANKSISTELMQAQNQDQAPSPLEQQEVVTEQDQERIQLVNTLKQLDIELAESSQERKQVTLALQSHLNKAPKPSAAASMFSVPQQGPTQVNQTEQSSKLDYPELIEAISRRRNELHNNFKDVDKDLKQLVHEAMGFKDAISYETLKENPNHARKLISELLSDVFKGEDHRKGLAISVAISEVIRNSHQEERPTSALSTFTYDTLVGKKSPTYEIASKVLEGYMSADDYYTNCEKIIGKDVFDKTLGQEYQEYLETKTQQSHQENMEKIVTQQQFEHAPSL
ncbi:hypothetical protein [Vibrio sp. Hal054]|uniref:hypothetical protein n=1 Tax=Vibrio sp. Hal054 TaxID=3035158 RepID=UPI00301DA441